MARSRSFVSFVVRCGNAHLSLRVLSFFALQERALLLSLSFSSIKLALYIEIRESKEEEGGIRDGDYTPRPAIIWSTSPRSVSL